MQIGHKILKVLEQTFPERIQVTSPDGNLNTSKLHTTAPVISIEMTSNMSTEIIVF